jgi:hypothetical protein
MTEAQAWLKEDADRILRDKIKQALTWYAHELCFEEWFESALQDSVKKAIRVQLQMREEASKKKAEEGFKGLIQSMETSGNGEEAGYRPEAFK